MSKTALNNSLRTAAKRAKSNADRLKREWIKKDKKARDQHAKKAASAIRQGKKVPAMSGTPAGKAAEKAEKAYKQALDQEKEIRRLLGQKPRSTGGGTRKKKRKK